MVEIVLDKSYLDGAATAEVRAVWGRYIALMPQELFFEMMTTARKSQRRCFAKLPDGDTPVVLIPPVGVLIDFERQHQEACGPLSRHRIDRRPYAFNRGLRDGSLVLGPEDSAVFARWQTQVDVDTRAFVASSLGIADIFPELAQARGAKLQAAVGAAQHRVATDLDFVRRIYGAAAPSDAPPPHRIGPQWAAFRFFQCRMLAALRVFASYQGALPKQAGPKFWRCAEHSMLDTYYLALGCLAGSLATRDVEIKEAFMLLCPDSVKVAPDVFGREG